MFKFFVGIQLFGLKTTSHSKSARKELELAAYQTEPENQAELVPGRDSDKIKKFNFFQII